MVALGALLLFVIAIVWVVRMFVGEQRDLFGDGDEWRRDRWR